MLAVIVIVIARFCVGGNTARYDGPVQKVTASKEQIERGSYLAQSVLTVRPATRLPAALRWRAVIRWNPRIGTIYGSNLTPSADYGIGRWTKDDFYKALTEGVTPTGRHLFPAMPYTSYKNISRQDSDDIYALSDDAPGGGCCRRRKTKWHSRSTSVLR